MRPFVWPTVVLLAFITILGSGCARNAGELGIATQESGESLSTPGEAREGALRVSALTEPRETQALSLLIAGPQPESLNPWRDPSDLELLLFPRAIRRNPETLDWEPWMAESWRFGEDGRSVEATIREGARWSDGRTLSAMDWVAAGNRYFSDPGLRTPYREVPEYAGLEPRWELMEELRFRIRLARPVDESTLLSLLYLPPLPSAALSGEGAGEGGDVPSQELNALWRLSPPRSSPGASALVEEIPSAGPYELIALKSTESGGVTARLHRRPEYRDPRFGTAAARSVTVRYASREAALDLVGRQETAPPDLVYFASPSKRGGENGSRESPPSGYRLLLAGADLTPAILILRQGLSGREEFAQLVRTVAEEYARERGLVPRSYPVVAETVRLFPDSTLEGGGGGTPGSSSEAASSAERGAPTPETSEELRILLPEEETHLRFGEALRGAAGERGLSLSLEPHTAGELATKLLAGEGWDVMLLEVREPFDAILGEPLLGNALPVTGEWSRPASRVSARSLSVEPFGSSELSAIGTRELGSQELPSYLIRLWRNVATSPREADRRRAAGALRRLWESHQPWIYLYDEERIHYARRGVENLIFRHLPGAELGTVVPLVYHQAGGTR